MAKIQKKSKQQFHLISFFYFPPKDCPSGGQLSPLGFAACQSKNCSNRAVHAPTLQFSHRTRRTHRTFWQIRASHRLHRLTQIRRVWHPCHTHAATKLSSPQNSRNTQKRLAEKKNLCTSVKSVGGSSPPEASVYSVKSVGEFPPPEISVNSVNSVGGLAQTNLEWVLWKEFGGQRGYGRDAIPTQPQNYLPTEFTEHTETTGGEEKSVNSVKSVGGSSPPEASVKICAICGRISSA